MMGYDFDLASSDFVHEDHFFMGTVDLTALDALRPSLNPAAASLVQDPIAYVPSLDYVVDEGSVLFDNVRMSIDQERLAVDLDYALPSAAPMTVDIPTEAFARFLKTAPILF